MVRQDYGLFKRYSGLECAEINRQMFISDFIINLSQYKLNESEISLLNKGLSFIPTVKLIPLGHIIQCKQRNLRSIKLKDFFQSKQDRHYDPDDFINRFNRPSKWEPNFEKLQPATKRVILDISSYTSQLFRNGLTEKRGKEGRLVACNSHSAQVDNLTPCERKALHNLTNNKDIIIKPADKGGAVVVLDSERYRQEGLRQLLNPVYYKELENFDTKPIVDKINRIITVLYGQGYITEKQALYFYTDIPVKHRPFYLLPKVHKPLNKWPHPAGPEGRPICSDCGSETQKICELIEYFIQPLSQTSPAYIKDTYDFIEAISNKSIPTEAVLISADVTALYTNMKIDLILKSVKDIMEEFPRPSRPDLEILMLLEIVLLNNVFEFDNRLFLQVLGTAMGKGCAVSLSGIYLRKLDLAALQKGGDSLELFFRFIDDIFAVWSGSQTQLLEFQDYLNNLIPGISITFQIKHRVIEFLDTLVYTVPDPMDPTSKLLKTRIYFKPTDTHQLLHGDSYHPKHTTKGILKSQLLRFKRISHCYADYNSACCTLYNVLKHRGYPRTAFRVLKFYVWFKCSVLKRNLNQDQKEIWPVVNYYDSIGTHTARYTCRRIESLKFAEKFRIISAFKRHRNLKEILCKSRFSMVEA